MTFSVIIPVYNVAPYLKACLDSVVVAVRRLDESSAVQSSTSHLQPVVEIICVDDGSTDGSGAILEAYSKSNFAVQSSTSDLQPVFRVLHQSNAGVAAARNRGLNAATGEWLLFVDSDDVVRDTLFADLAKLIERLPTADFIGFGLCPMNVDDSHPQWHSGNADCHIVETLNIDRVVGDHFASFGVYRGAYRRDRFGDIRFPSYARGEDLVYVARVIARASSHVYLRREEYGYRNRPASAVHSQMSADSVRDAIRFHVEVFRILSDSGKSIATRLWQMRMAQWILRLPIAMSRYRRSRDWDVAWKEWRESMKVALRLPCVDGVCATVARFATICPFCPLIALACRIGIRWLRYRGT